MTLVALLERYAGYERRALLLYRSLAGRFDGEPGPSALWRALSDAEASHFTTLRLASDRVAMAGAAATEAGHLAEGLDDLERRLDAIEQAAARPDLSLGEAVALTVEWEEREIARIRALVAALPAPVQPHVERGLLGQLDGHRRDLVGLARAAGVDDLCHRAEALGTDSSAG